MLTGTWMSAIFLAMALSAVPSDTPSGKLKAMEVETEVPV